MKRRFLTATLGLFVLAGVSLGQGKAKPSDSSSCGEFGTSVQFEKSPSDAARRALKEEKLVMVLHISGHFEYSDYT